MSVGLRCVCHGVTYTSVTAYLADHEPEQLSLELDAAAARHPSTASRFVGTFQDGAQVFVEVYADRKMTVATRPTSWATWGPPTFLDEAP